MGRFVCLILVFLVALANVKPHAFHSDDGETAKVSVFEQAQSAIILDNEVASSCCTSDTDRSKEAHAHCPMSWAILPMFAMLIQPPVKKGYLLTGLDTLAGWDRDLPKRPPRILL